MNPAAATDPSGLTPPKKDGVVELTAADLHGGHAAFCPNPKMPLWSGHPRVFIDIATTGHGACPYCGTTYRLRAGETLGGH